MYLVVFPPPPPRIPILFLQTFSELLLYDSGVQRPSFVPPEWLERSGQPRKMSRTETNKLNERRRLSTYHVIPEKRRTRHMWAGQLLLGPTVRYIIASFPFSSELSVSSRQATQNPVCVSSRVFLYLGVYNHKNCLKKCVGGGGRGVAMLFCGGGGQKTGSYSIWLHRFLS